MSSVCFYQEQGRGDPEWKRLALEECMEFLKSEETESDAAELLAKLEQVRQKGPSYAEPDRYQYDSAVGEWVHLFPCGKVAVLYAVETDTKGGLESVTALRFCRTSSAYVSAANLSVAQERLCQLRKGTAP